MINLTASEASKFLDLLETYTGDFTALADDLEGIANPVRVINLTPHDVVVRDNEGNMLKRYAHASLGESACVIDDDNKKSFIDGVPVRLAKSCCITGLPSPSPNTYYIVSTMVAWAAPKDRHDLLTPDRTIRDEQGRIIGCLGFTCS